MQHIDKNNSVSETSFKAVVDSYITSGCYRYDDISVVDRRKLRGVLGNEQNGMCAYCMKKVDFDEGTSDHVIPKSIPENEYGRARRHLGQGLYRGDFIWDKKYTSSSFPCYYPHSLAYGNLVFACADCNACKDCDLIRPLFFGNPVDGINYTDKGLLQTAEKDALPQELKTRLNTDLYRYYRCIWRAVKLSGLTVSNLIDADNRNSRKQLLKSIQPYVTDSGLLREIVLGANRFTSDSVWNSLLRFQWFWDYY